MAETDNKKYTYTPFDYDDYTESDVVKGIGEKKTAAESALAGYGDFTWSQQGKYDSLIKAYEDRDGFSYDFNADALYQQYKNKYIQQGKMAMADTMGQAAAMTGGYGNSYAQTVGQQQYQASLDKLNDVIPELYQLAYDKYNQEGQDMLNMIGLLGNERDFAYGQWGDKYNQLVADRNYYGTQYGTERDFDYGQYTADRTIAQNDHYQSEGAKYDAIRDAIEDDRAERELKMKEEAWNLEKSELQKVVDSTNYSGKGTHPTGGNYDNGGYSDAVVKQAQKFVGADADGYWGTKSTSAAQAAGYGSLAEVVKAMGGLGIDLSQIPGINTDNASYFDSSGNFKKAEHTGTSDGKATFSIDGKTVTLEAGVNPYTNTTNPDVKNGTFSNGYQPNNVNGKKLSKSGIQDYMNGVLQNIWKTSDGKLWIWDGTQNKYLEYQE